MKRELWTLGTHVDGAERDYQLDSLAAAVEIARAWAGSAESGKLGHTGPAVILEQTYRKLEEPRKAIDGGKNR